MRRFSLAVLAGVLVASAPAVAGVSQIVTRIGSVGGGGSVRTHILKICANGDWQNYRSKSDVRSAPDDALRVALFKAMIDDEIGWGCDFAIMPGDFTDSTGGADQVSGNLPQDDPNSLACLTSPPSPVGLGCLATNQDTEWTETRQQGYDRLIAAHIPVFIVLGNHDSCIDMERHFPSSEWLGYSWGRAVNTVAGLCGNDTAHGGGGTQALTVSRSALISTRIGTVCVVGLPFSQAVGVGGDDAWIPAQVGCGSNRPTILVSHGGLNRFPPITGLGAGQKASIIATYNGHFICDVNTPCMTQTTTTTAGMNALVLQMNWQELSSGDPIGTGHTGWSEWAHWTIDLDANTSILEARNPYLGGTSDLTDPNTTANRNGTLALPFNFCALFGGC